MSQNNFNFFDDMSNSNDHHDQETNSKSDTKDNTRIRISLTSNLATQDQRTIIPNDQ